MKKKSINLNKTENQVVDNLVLPVSKSSSSKSPRSKGSKNSNVAQSGGVSAEILAQLGDASTIVKLSVKQCPIDEVTVYADRAEIVRKVEFTANEGGLYDLIIEGITIHSMERSIRVQPHAIDVAEKKKKKKSKKDKSDDSETPTPASDDNDNDGDGDEAERRAACTILEVSSEKGKLDADSASDDMKALVAQAAELDKQSAELNRQLDVVNTQSSWLNGYSASLMDKKNPAPSLEIATQFLTLLADKTATFKARTAEIYSDLETVQSERRQVDRRIAELTALEGGHATHGRNVTVGLFSQSRGKVMLRLSYMVTGASWRSSYDCRVLSQADKSMQLIYYGDVRNGSGEHWEQAKISLSTAEPHTGGEPPRMSTLHVDFGYSYAPQKQNRRSRKSKQSNPLYSAAPQQQQMFVQTNMLMLDNDDDDAASLSEEDYIDVDVETANVRTSEGATASFDIAGRKTIPNDSKFHKVTISITSLNNVKFTHTAVARVGKVFLRGNAVNESSGPLLAGDCSIFIEGSFVCTNQLKTVLPGEDFSLFLGVDSNVTCKVYPDKAKQKQVGMWSKSKVEDKRRRFVIKNHRADDVVVSLFEQLPLSKNDSIKVKLIEPSSDDLASKKSNVILNEFNNLRWTIPLKRGKDAEIIFHYEITYPSDKTITLQE